MVKKFSEFSFVNEELSATSRTDEVVPMPSGAKPADIETDVTSPGNAKSITSIISVSMKEIEKMFFDAHVRIKNVDLKERPLLEIQAEDGHTIKIMLHR